MWVLILTLLISACHKQNAAQPPAPANTPAPPLVGLSVMLFPA